MKVSNEYKSLGGIFHESARPTPVRKPELFLWNNDLAHELLLFEEPGLDKNHLAEYFSGNLPLPGSSPLAIAYAGHQFGNFVPQLGDGRAHLLGELNDRNGQIKDIQLKGSGQTAFSRNGDGRCAMGPAIREFVMSEAMYALGVPTTRCLAVTTTGETVYRETPQPGAVVTRIAASHLRVGTFEFFAARKNHQAIETLCDFAISRHYPDIEDKGPERFQLLLQKVIEKQAKLVVEWLRVGFIHGVMNTDNTAISGETIDFGPCAMMGAYDLQTVYSSIDHQGRYAYGNQPTIIQWNMARFAETLIPLLHENEDKAIEIANEQVNGFNEQFSELYFKMLANKTGLSELTKPGQELISDLLEIMENKQLDYTITFNRLTRSLSSESAEQKIRQDLGQWFDKWQQHLQALPEDDSEIQALMRKTNPVVIPRNHHMENIINRCIETGTAEAANTFLKALRSPYRETNTTLQFQDAPMDGDMSYQTFCGT